MPDERVVAYDRQLIPEGRIADQSWTRFLICGGRTFGLTTGLDWTDPEQAAILSERQKQLTFLEAALDELYANFYIAALAHGDAPGADQAAANWALSKNPRITIHRFPANWKKYGKSAGPLRNMEMLKTFSPDVVVAFPGGRGTEHMKTIAREKGVRVICPLP